MTPQVHPQEADGQGIRQLRTSVTVGIWTINGAASVQAVRTMAIRRQNPTRAPKFAQHAAGWNAAAKPAHSRDGRITQRGSVLGPRSAQFWIEKGMPIIKDGPKKMKT